MRTVHEIETGKPQEPVVKLPTLSDQKTKRRRSPSLTENGHGEDDLEKSDQDDSESALYSAAHRYRYLKRKLRWATDRNEILKEELEEAEDSRWRGWAQKEKLLDQLLSKEKINLGYQGTDS
jgi:hypothetical protein